MRLILAKITVLFGMLLITLVILAAILPVDTDHYLAAIIDKHERLAMVKSPKLIFVGGSNLALGIDSEKIQESLALPVINMGLHADLGLRFMLEEIKPHLRHGDVVVIVPEFEQFWGVLNGGAPLLKILRYRPRAIEHIGPVEQWTMLFLQSINYIQSNLRFLLIQIFNIKGDSQYLVYNRRAFNSYGDFVKHYNEPGSDLTQASFNFLKNEEFDQESVDILNRFQMFATARGVRTYFAFPCVWYGYYKTKREWIRIVDRHLRDELRIQILGRPAENTLPAQFFYDTEYHLNKEGVVRRTEKIIQYLKAAGL